jgi:hypothetical protein
MTVYISLRQDATDYFLTAFASQSRRIVRIYAVNNQKGGNSIFFHESFDCFKILVVPNADWIGVHKNP